MWVDKNTLRYVWVKIFLSDPKEQVELLQTGFPPYTPADADFLPLKEIDQTANPTHAVNGCPTWSISNPAGGLRALLRTKVLKQSDPNTWLKKVSLPEAERRERKSVSMFNSSKSSVE